MNINDILGVWKQGNFWSVIFLENNSFIQTSDKGDKSYGKWQLKNNQVLVTHNCGFKKILQFISNDKIISKTENGQKHLFWHRVDANFDIKQNIWISLSCNKKSNYFNFIQIQIKNNTKLGLKTYFTIIGDQQKIQTYQNYILHYIKKIDHYSQIWQSQISRIYASKFIKDKMIISDIDMLILSKSYIWLLTNTQSDISISRKDPYKKQRYAMCYICGNGDILKDIFSTNCEFQQFCNILYSTSGSNWDSDQMYITTKINQNKSIHIQYLDYVNIYRIDRSNGCKYIQSDLRNGKYTDCHCFSDCLKNYTKINKISNDNYSNQINKQKFIDLIVSSKINRSTYHSHLYVLENIFKFTKIHNCIQFGCGYGSTPILLKNVDKLISIQMQKQQWYWQIKTLMQVLYKDKFTIIKDLRKDSYDFLNNTIQTFDMAIIDGHGESRPQCVNKCFQKNIKYIIVHDTQEKGYGWGRVKIPSHYYCLKFSWSPAQTTLYTIDSNIYDIVKKNLYNKTQYNKFDIQYIHNTIGDSISNPRSGDGSTIEDSINIISFIKQNNIKQICDIGCGDFNYMKSCVNDSIEYVGFDISNHIIYQNNNSYSNNKIKFVNSNACDISYIDSQMIIIKDLFYHIPMQYVQAILYNSMNLWNWKYLIIGNNNITRNILYTKNEDISRMVNILIHPYYTRKPDRVIKRINSKPIYEKYNRQYLVYYNQAYIEPTTIKFSLSQSQKDTNITIDQHTFNKQALVNNENVLQILDLGCRGFNFSKQIIKLTQNNCEITAIDAGIDIIGDPSPNIKFYNKICISNKDIDKMYLKFNYLQDKKQASSIYQVGGKSVYLQTFFIQKYYDLIKMDIQGAQYDILQHNNHPIANQITCQFHQHVKSAKIGMHNLEKLILYLQNYYDIKIIQKHSHWGCENLCDVLMINKNPLYVINSKKRKRIIVNVSTGKFYTQLQKHLKKSIQKYNSNSDYDYFSYKCMPNKCKQHKYNPYEFKMYAINHFINIGYQTIIWCDSAILFCDSPMKIFNEIQSVGYFFFSGNLQKGTNYNGQNNNYDLLSNYCSQFNLQYFKLKLSEINKSHLIGGSIFGFDINNIQSKKYFTQAFEYMIKNNFASAPRHDETIFSIICHKYNLKIQKSSQMISGGFNAGKSRFVAISSKNIEERIYYLNKYQ